MKVLAVVSEPISAGALRSAIGGDRVEDAEVMVIAPALHSSALRFWVSDADEAIERAAAVERESVAALREEDIASAGDVGESDIAQAVRDALVDFDADRVVLFVHPQDSRRYREDVQADELAEDLGVVVETFELDDGAGG